MKYALVAMCVGVLAYFSLLAFQSPQARRDLDAWGDCLFASGVLSAFLAIVMFWGLFDRLSDATLTSLVERLFRRRPHSGLVDLRTLPGFAAASFTAFAAVHVLVLKILERVGRRHDA